MDEELTAGSEGAVLDDLICRFGVLLALACELLGRVTRGTTMPTDFTGP